MRALLVLVVALATAAPASAQVSGAALDAARAQVVKLPPRAPNGKWDGRLSHLAGTSHYDGGEWIYEDYPFTAYGAAQLGVGEAQQALALLSDTLPPAERLPGAAGYVSAATGAGPYADEADVTELRVAVRRGRVRVLARTTAMLEPAGTALLLLFDRDGAGETREVGLGSGLRSARADVAALVTAAGTEIVDLATGATTTAPARAVADGYENQLRTRLPLALVRAPRGIRLVAAAGVETGAGLVLAKALPRREPGVQTVHDRLQALALAARDLDRLFTRVSLKRLRRGDRERLTPGAGYSVRTMLTPVARAKEEGGTEGPLRDYGLYLPGRLDGAAPATLMLRGSGMTAHSLPAVTPGFTRQLGDGNGAIVVSPGGRSGFDLYNGAAYRDALQALRDAGRLARIDRDRVTVAGYSMGGYATYMFAATRPDLFAAAFVVEGPVGGAQPATKSPIVNAFADVVPMLSNAGNTPIAIYQGTHDANVPPSNALAAAGRLRELGYRYRLNLFPGDHFTPGVFDDYTIGARYLKDARRPAVPDRIDFTRDMAFERAIDTASFTDAPGAGDSVGLRFDRAWYVRDLRPVDDVARIQVAAADAPATAFTQGVDPPGFATPSAFEEQRWAAPPAPGALAVTLTGVRGVTIRRRVATIATDGPVTVRLPGCTLSLAAGEHPATCPKRRAR